MAPKKTKTKIKKVVEILPPARVFDDIKPNAKPCPICLELAKNGCIQPRAVMPLPPFPARHKDGRQCCRDCQATTTAMRIWGIHPDFAAARLCVANERCEALTMPLGVAEAFGMCRKSAGVVVRPCSIQDLEAHSKWLERNNIPDNACTCTEEFWTDD